MNIIEQTINWPFPLVVGGIPCNNPEAVRKAMQARKQTVKRVFPDNAECQRIDFQNMQRNVGEALV